MSGHGANLNFFDKKKDWTSRKIINFNIWALKDIFDFSWKLVFWTWVMVTFNTVQKANKNELNFVKTKILENNTWYRLQVLL